MSYEAYLPQTDNFKSHFSLVGSKRKPKDFYIVRSPKVGHGDLPVVTVTPTQGDVARAKADIQREREEHINEVIPVLAHSASKRPKKKNSKGPPAKKSKK